MKRLLLITTLLYTTGCSSLVGQSLFTSDNEGRFLLSADAAGLNEFGKAVNGLVVTGKATPDTRDAYFQNQDNETQAKVMRFKVRTQTAGDQNNGS